MPNLELQRSSILILNLMLAVLGLSIIAVGIDIFSNPLRLTDFPPEHKAAFDIMFHQNYFDIGKSIMYFGCLILVVTFIQWLGLQRLQLFHYTFCFSVMVFIIISITVVITSLVHIFRFNARQLLTIKMVESIRKYTEIKEYQTMWDTLQRDNKCCGLYGPTDWANASTFPSSCCDVPSCDFTKAHFEGCSKFIMYNNVKDDCRSSHGTIATSFCGFVGCLPYVC